MTTALQIKLEKTSARAGSSPVIGCAPSKTQIVSFSGGQTSGYMLRRIMDANARDFDSRFQVIFDNTGKEYDQTLNFVQEVSVRWGVPIIWLEYTRKDNEHSFRVVSYETAARRKDPCTPFDEMLEWSGSLPNVMARGCSGQLKVRTTRRYLQANGYESWDSYVGIRADESHRTLEILAQCPKYIRAHFPLNDDGITLADVDAYWDAQPFKLNLEKHEGNCDLCYLKAKWKRLTIMRKDPEAALWWIGWEKKMEAKGVTGNGARWRENVSYEGLLAEAQHPEFDFTEQDVPCSCVVGGYRDTDDEGHNDQAH